MTKAAILTLAGLCLGIALSGLLAALLRKSSLRERSSLGAVYIAFMGMIALPVVKTFAGGALIHFMPLLLVLLLVLPPALYHFIAVKTGETESVQVPLRDLALPLAGGVVCLGYWALPRHAKEAMFIFGDLPPGIWPAALAFATFGLIMIWLMTSFAYVVAMLRRLTSYRAQIRHLYSDADEKDQRWVDVVIVVLVLIWAAGALSLAEDNLAATTFFAEEVFLALIAGGLMVLNIFAPVASPNLNLEHDEAPPDPKYARSALTSDHAAKLADRLETAMRTDALYFDPNLSLQKLSQHIGALPNHVSQTLNQEIGATFFDYVARWRIEASKHLIATGETTVLDVALDVGFNSRSAFYKAFKRETGMTPKSFRAAQLKVA